MSCLVKNTATVMVVALQTVAASLKRTTVALYCNTVALQDITVLVTVASVQYMLATTDP